MSYFTLTSTTAQPTNFSPPTGGVLGSHDGVWVDPYNPEEIYYANASEILKYHLANDVYTVVYSGPINFDTITRSFTDAKLYTFETNATGIYDVTDPTTPVQVATATGLVRALTTSADGTKLYYLTSNTSNLTEYVIATDTHTVIYSHGSTLGNNTYILTSDPTDGTYLYFMDANEDLYAYNVSLGTAALIIAGPVPKNVFCARAMDGVLYMAPWSQSTAGLLQINPDGTNQQVLTGSLLGKIMLLDTVNKKLFHIDFTKNIREFSVPNLGDVPPYVPPSSLTIVPGPVNALITIDVISGVTGHRLTYTEDGGSEVLAVTDLTELTYNISTLVPETIYTISLYTTDGSGYTFVESVSITTLANSASNYTISDFSDGTSGFDLTNLDATARDAISEVMDELFTTGDEIEVSLASGGTANVVFVNRGGTVPVADVEAVLFPFDTAAGASQSATMTLSDNVTTSAVGYDETVDSITISGVEYFVGDIFVLDGKKVTVSSS